jgi:hypothetical protein
MGDQQETNVYIDKVQVGSSETTREALALAFAGSSSMWGEGVSSKT